MTNSRTGTKNGRLVSAALLLGVASLGSRLVGVLRDRVLSTTFGAGDTLDAFVAAFRLPDLIFNLVIVGALSAAFIPLFTEKLVKGKKYANGRTDADMFASSVMNLVLIVITVLSVMYMLTAQWLVPLITPGFTGEKLRLTIQLSQIMALQPILLGISFVFSGILNSHKRFLSYSLAPIVYNIGITLGALVFYPYVGIAGLGWGVVLGAALHMLVQLPSILAIGWQWHPMIEWASHDFKRLRRMILPRMLGLAAQQVNLFIVTILGSGLMTGTISIFYMANNLQSLPIGVFGLAFAQAAFPTLAENIAREDHRSFRNTLTKSFRYILFFVIPTSVAFFLLRAQIIRVVYGAGAYDWEDTILTFRTFGILIMSLFAQATLPLLTRAFYVQHNTKIPVITSLISIAANIILALVLVSNCQAHFWLLGWKNLPCGIEGLALAFSLSNILNLVLLLGSLHWTMDGFNDEEVLKSLVRITGASLVAGVVIQILKYVVAYGVDQYPAIDMHTFIGVFIQLVVSSAGGVLAYIGVCLLLHCDELEAVWRFLPRKWRLTAGTETTRFTGLPE
jgi:putative peptidoglycan lipid II flippase